MVVTPITVIRDPRAGVRSSVALSEKYFLQCFVPSEGNEQRVYTVLQLRWYSRNLPHNGDNVVEQRVETNGLVSGKDLDIESMAAYLTHPHRPGFSLYLVTELCSQRQL